MRGKRSKQYRKLMQQFGLSFNFREPYQVLVDAQIIQDAARFKMRLGGMLERTLHGEIKPMITQCCIRHLYNAEHSADKDAWIDVAKHAERRRCGHHELDQPLSTLECLLSVVDPKQSGTNKHRYVVASQDQEVRQAMRGIAGVPLVYITRSVMILEPMAARTGEIIESEEKGKIRAGLRGTRGVLGVKRKRDDTNVNGEDDNQQAISRKKVRGPSGPNPLSVKKPKVDKKGTSSSTSTLRRIDEKNTATRFELGMRGSENAVGEQEGAKKRRRKRILHEPNVQESETRSSDAD